MSKDLSIYIYMMNDKYFHRMTIIGNILAKELILNNIYLPKTISGRDLLVVGFPTTCAISAFTTNVVSSTLAQTRCTRYNIM